MEEHRKTKIVNPHYQYHNALGMVLFAIIAFNVIIVAASLVSGLYGGVRWPTSVYLVIAGGEVLVLVVAWFLAIRFSHRVAGPVYAIGRELDKLSGGDLRIAIHLRPRDEFHDTVERINRGVAHIHDEVAGIKALVAKLGANPSPEQLEELKRCLDRLITATGSDENR